MHTITRCVSSLPVPVISRGALSSAPTGLGDIGENGSHALRIGRGGLGRLLRTPKLRRGRPSSIALGDLLRRL